MPFRAPTALPTVRAADETILSEKPAVKALWGGQFGELYRVDPQRCNLPVDDIETLVAGPPISCVEMLKAGGGSAVKWLHRLFYSVWNSSMIPTD